MGWPRHIPLSLAAAGAMELTSRRALAHGAAHDISDDAPWWTLWNWDAPTLLSLAILSLLYATGLARLRRSAGPGRGVSTMQATAFAGSIVALVIALISPLDPLSDALGSVHMIQHMFLMMVAAPLFVAGSPALVMIWALPRDWRRRLGTLLSRLGNWKPPWYPLWQPILLCALFALTLWIWHLPALYQAALRNRLVHEAQHVTFFVGACLFWRVLIDPLSRLRLSFGAGVLYLFLTSLHATLLGVFMALSPRIWYDDYIPRTEAWNLTPLEDQQLAGLIMWMPACMIYTLAAAVLFALQVREVEDRAPLARPEESA